MHKDQRATVHDLTAGISTTGVSRSYGRRLPVHDVAVLRIAPE